MRRSLDGLSVGDAFGERFFRPGATSMIAARGLPTPMWRWTDDTAMALGIVELLEKKGTIDQHMLALLFARNFDKEPGRGYGGGATHLLQQIHDGVPWRTAATSLFGGQGSRGNGAAMRVAPLGAFFAGAGLDRVVEEAIRSAEVTHAHLDGQAGAIAVAVAAAVVATGGDAARIWDEVLARTPESPTRAGLVAARQGIDRPLEDIVEVLGSGDQVLSSDTVPFVIWCATRFLDAGFEEAMWQTVSGLGDRDTTCAMVGGIIGVRHPPPAEWLAAREMLPR
jgi:ADP-ribosylglycohydrolase